MEKYTIIVEQDEDGVLVGSVVELPGCHTQGKTFDELFERMKEAIELYLGAVFGLTFGGKLRIVGV